MTTDFWIDQHAGDQALRFFSMLRHSKGEFAGETFKLSPYQEEPTWRLFAEKRCDEYGKKIDVRRYRFVYIEVPRKQGKTTWAAGLGLMLTCFDNEPSAEVYAIAKTKEQATLVYDIALAMIEDNDMLLEFTTRFKSPKRIYVPSTRSQFKAMASDDGAAHGLNAHGIIFDELHNQPNRLLWDAMVTSRGARRQPLVVSLTTAGRDRSSICWEQHQYAKGVLQGTIDDPTYMPIIYAADEKDDWTDPEVWKKANPNLGVTVRMSFLEEEYAKAKNDVTYQNTFRNLFLNQWTGQDKRWLDVGEWDQCQDELTRDELWEYCKGKACWCGLDLSAVRDATAFVMVFHDDRTPEERYIILPMIWMPRKPATKRDAQDTRQLRNWAGQGWVRDDAGEKDISMDGMFDAISELREQYNIQEIAFDPYHAKGLVEMLENARFKMTSFNQRPAMYAQPCEKFHTLLGRTAFRHDGNPVMRWMIGNVAKREDHNGNKQPDKGKSGDKIDGVVAAIMGVGLAMRVAKIGFYETNEVEFV